MTVLAGRFFQRLNSRRVTIPELEEPAGAAERRIGGFRDSGRAGRRSIKASQPRRDALSRGGQQIISSSRDTIKRGGRALWRRYRREWNTGRSSMLVQ
jgi:hypothetical protein